MGRSVMMIEPDELTRMFQDLEDRIVERLRPQMVKHEEMITQKEAAMVLKIRRETMSRYLRTGVIPAELIHVVGGRKMFYESELKRHFK